LANDDDNSCAQAIKGALVMTSITPSRRKLLGGTTLALAAVSGLAAPAIAQAGEPLDPRTEAIIRKHYDAWVQKDWPVEDRLLADDFTFSSPAGDDHISKSLFKRRCWDTQSPLIKHYTMLRLFGSGAEAFAMYDCLTTNDKTFQNVEYFQLHDGKIKNLVCYFGAPSNYPSEVSAGRT
jgi:hypothetical protein